MIPLYEIQSQIHSIISQLETDDPLQYELVMTKLDELETDRTTKLEGCCCYVKNLRAEIQLYADEITRLKDKMQRCQKREQSFLDYMKHCLPDNEPWKHGIHSIAWRSSEQLDVEDESKVPIQYLREKLSYEINKIDAKRDIKCGAKIPGLKLTTKQNLQVK